MPFVDKVYWITDVNGKRHLKNVKELVHPTIEEQEQEERRARIFHRIIEQNGEGLRRLAKSDYEPFDSDRRYWEEEQNGRVYLSKDKEGNPSLRNTKEDKPLSKSEQRTHDFLNDMMQRLNKEENNVNPRTNS